MYEIGDKGDVEEQVREQITRQLEQEDVEHYMPQHKYWN